jgi:hypothetical protein
VGAQLTDPLYERGPFTSERLSRPLQGGDPKILFERSLMEVCKLRAGRRRAAP